MTILTTVTSNLAGGVSQQSLATRLDNQLLEQVNGYSTVVDGLTKRPPTKFKRVLDDYDWANYTLHTFRRSETEEYLVVAGHETLRVLDIEGVEYPVNAEGSANINTNYLDLLGDVSSDGLLEQFVTFLPGPEVTALDAEDLTGPFVKGSHPARKLTKQPGILDVGEYTATEEPVSSALFVFSLCVRALTESPEAEFRIGAKNTDDDRVYTAFKFDSSGTPFVVGFEGGVTGGVEEIGGGWWRVWTMVDQLSLGIFQRMFIGIEQAVMDQSIAAFGPRVNKGVSKPLDYFLSPDNLRMTTVQDTTILTNGTIVPQLLDATSPEIPEASAAVWVRQGAYSTKYTVKIVWETSARTTYTVERDVYTWDGVDGTTPPPVNLNSIDTTFIAAQMESFVQNEMGALVQNIPSSEQLATEVRGSQVYFTPPFGGRIISLSTTDGLADEGMVSIFEDVPEFSDLPEEAVNGFTIKITGDPGEDVDDYWVKFETDNDVEFGDGSWEEIPAPDTQIAYDPDTMPHTLVRRLTPTGDISFTYGPAEWTERTAGDAESLPPFSAVVNERPIHEVFFYKNRLGFLSDQNVILSAAGRYFTFWQASARDVRDDDPIDVSINSRDSSRIDFATEAFERLVLQTSEGQWSLTGEPSLTPRTVEATRISSYESIPGVRPVSTGESLFLPYPQGPFSAVRELFPVDNNRLTASDVSMQIPRYIPGTILDMAATTVEDVLFVRSDGDRGCLFVYKWMNSGQERVQSAWSKFTFTDAQVVSVAFFESVAIILIRRSGSIQLECMDLTEQEAQNGELVVHLDRQITSDHADISFVYDDVKEATVITLPWNPGYFSEYQVVTASGKAHKAFYTDFVTLEVDADITGEGFTVGERYLLDVVMAEPVFRQNNSRGGRSQVGEGGYRLLRGWLFADSTGYVTVTNTSPGAVTVDEFGDEVQFTPFTDKLRIPLLCNSDDLQLRIRNYSPFPTRVTSFEWVGRYVTRAEGRAG